MTMGRKKKEGKPKEEKPKIERFVAANRVEEREGQGWVRVANVAPMRNGSVLMVKKA